MQGPAGPRCCRNRRSSYTSCEFLTSSPDDTNCQSTELMGTFASQRNLTPTRFGRLAAGSAAIHHPAHRMSKDYLTTIKNFVCNSSYSPAPAEPPMAQLLEHGLSELLSKLFPVGVLTFQTHSAETSENIRGLHFYAHTELWKAVPSFPPFFFHKGKLSQAKEASPTQHTQLLRTS